MIRTFIAINIPDNIKELIAEFRDTLVGAHFPVKWVRPENIHLTLKFIGEIPQNLVDRICDDMKNTPPLCEPFEIAVSGTDVFPNLNKPRVYWIGITHGAGELIQLARDIDEKTARHGIEREKRPFRPHLTLGRVKSPKPVRGIDKFISPDIFYAGTFIAEEIVVMQSVLKPSGPVYTPLAVHSLRQGT